jgi:XisI protein
MDTLKKEVAISPKEALEKVLQDYANIPYAYGKLESEVIVSRDEKHYLLMTSGWSPEDARVHYCVVHLEWIEDKVWIQYDGIEGGIATALVEAGIPSDRIVLGFHPQELRKHTGFAVN